MQAWPEEALTVGSESTIRFLLIWSWEAFWLLLFVWGYVKFGQSQRSAVRHKIWLAALFGVVLLPFVNYAIPSLALSSSVITVSPKAIIKNINPGRQINVLLPATPSPDSSPAPATHHLVRIWQLLMLIWVIGVLVNLLRFSLSCWNMRGILRRSTPITLANLGCDLPDLHHLRHITIALSDEIDSPLLFGVIDPQILLPANLLDWTVVEERVAILQHEGAHLKRGDNLISLFRAVLWIVFFFHPLVRYALNQLAMEAEMAADAEALNRGADPRAYTEIILKVVEKGLTSSGYFQHASFSAKQSLRRRLEVITEYDLTAGSRARRGYFAFGLVIIFGLILVLAPARSAMQTAKAITPPHTIVLIEKLTISGEGEYAPGEHLVRRSTRAVRSDGAFYELDEEYGEAGKQLQPGSKSLVFPDGLVVKMDDASRAKSTYRRPASDYIVSFLQDQPDPHARCMKTVAGHDRFVPSYHLDGEEAVNGMKSVKVVSEEGTFRLDLWLAPELGCDIVQMEANFGTSQPQVSRKTLQKILVGEPEASLFRVPAEYEEVLPSELQARIMERLRGKRPVFNAKDLSRLDDKYLANRP